LLLLLLLLEVVAHCTAGCGSQNGVVARNMTCHSANCGALQTPFRIGSVGDRQQRHTSQRHQNRNRSHASHIRLPLLLAGSLPLHANNTAGDEEVAKPLNASNESVTIDSSTKD
jgi:hypothetical protein